MTKKLSKFIRRNKGVERLAPMMFALLFGAVGLALLLVVRAEDNTDLENLGYWLDNHGVPSTAYWEEGNLLYGEALMPGQSGKFVVYDLDTQERIFVGGSSSNQRHIMVDSDGSAYVTGSGNVLWKYDPRTNSMSSTGIGLPAGGWLRASTHESSDGWIYGVTRSPERIFRFKPSTGQVDNLAAAWGYTTTVALDPTDTYMYYLPDAHGNSWRQGAPVLQFNVRTNEHKVIAFLDNVYRGKGYHVGGTYGLNLDSEGRRLFISSNASRTNVSDGGFGAPIMLMIDIPASERGVAVEATPRTASDNSFALNLPFTQPVQADAEDFSFVDATSEAGLIDPFLGAYVHAAAWGDVNNDGWVDLFGGMFTDSPTSYYQERGASTAAPNRLLLNQGGSFTDANQSAIEIFGRASGSVFADLDNDGDNDLVVSNNRKLGAGSRSLEPHHVYRNDNGTFVDISAASGIRASVENGRSVGVIDYNNDKLLDMIIVADQIIGGAQARTMLFKNNGDLTFSDVTDAAGLPTARGLGLAVADLNNDGWPDFVVAGGPRGDYGRNYMFINDRDGTFHEAHAGSFRWSTNGTEDYVSGADFGDVNRDGRLDMVITHHYGSSEERGIAVSPRLYINQGNDSNGDPTFQDVTTAAGLEGIVSKSPHVEIQDFDNDGWPDIYISIRIETSNGSMPYILRHEGLNDQTPQFSAPSYSGLKYYPGGPVADYNRDGRLDVFFEEFLPANHTPLFKNTTSGGNWVQVRVNSPETNGMGIGSKVNIYRAGQLGNQGALLGATEIKAGFGYSSGQPAIAHFGVGNETAVDIEVKLPFGGSTLSLSNVTVNNEVEVNGASSPTPSDNAHQGLETFTTTDSSSAFISNPGISPPTSFTIASTAPTVEFAPYPLPNYPGNPWSQWGQTTIASNGKYYSGVGDHEKPDGNTYLYEYDPVTKRLRAIGDIQTATDHVAGSWGHGKIHGGIHEASNGWLYTTSYWGSMTGIRFDDNYRGSVMLRYPLGVGGSTTPPPPSPKLGDINGDDRVDILDLSVMLSNWRRTTPHGADLNSDGIVDVLDLSVLLSRWNS